MAITPLSVGELLERAKHEPDPDWTRLAPHPSIVSSAAEIAHTWAEEHSKGATLAQMWRFGVLQALDHYESAKRLGGVELAQRMFAEAPEQTGASEIDASFAALADYLAERDGWQLPEWANESWRRTQPWFAMQPEIFHAEALATSPRPFRTRGVYTTPRGLSRA